MSTDNAEILTTLVKKNPRSLAQRLATLPQVIIRRFNHLKSNQMIAVSPPSSEPVIVSSEGLMETPLSEVAHKPPVMPRLERRQRKKAEYQRWREENHLEDNRDESDQPVIVLPDEQQPLVKIEDSEVISTTDRSTLGRQWTSRRVCQYARSAGLIVVPGGRHMRIVTPDGRHFQPIPSHRGNLPVGTAISLVKWIDSRRVRS